MNKDDTKQAIIGFMEFTKGITGNKDLKIPEDIAKEYGIEQDEKDTISRQAAIDAFSMFAEYESNRTNAEWVDRIRVVLSSLPPVQPISRWIPVSERLPEENGYYLTTTMYHEVYCDYWEEERFNRTEAVIAWMPLPEPYKVEPQEGK